MLSAQVLRTTVVEVLRSVEALSSSFLPAYLTSTVCAHNFELSFTRLLSFIAFPHREKHRMALFFLTSPAPFLHHSRRSRSICRRTTPRANINETNNSAREDEIAAKIASLRRMKRLQSQRGISGDDKPGEIESPEDKGNASTTRSFKALPDWKKEEMLREQMAEAEAFFNPGKAGTASPTKEDMGEDEYKPKVSTWGVFPRPDNISRTFGGGKRIQVGGVDLNSAESKKRDEAVAKKLEAYRAARGIDTVLEQEHHEEIEGALERAAEHMRRSCPYDAIKTLQAVEEFVSDSSRLGGKVFLGLALAYDTVGKRDEARDLYTRLRRNPFPEVSGKAKQLLHGFEAMDMLKIKDDTKTGGFRVTSFNLPDVSAGIEDRYETAVLTDKSQISTPIDAATSWLLFLLIVGPIAFVFLVLAPISR